MNKINKLKFLKILIISIVLFLYIIVTCIVLIEGNTNLIFTKLKIILIYTVFIGIIAGGIGSVAIVFLQHKITPKFNKAALKIYFISCGVIAEIIYFVICCKSRDVSDMAELIFVSGMIIAQALYLKRSDFD